MKLLEYQGKKLFADAGITIPEGGTVDTPEAAGKVAARLGKPVMVKAQIRIGGRGKAGGILNASNASDAKAAAEKLLGNEILNQVAREVLVEEKIDAERELYIGFTIDHDARMPVMLLCSEGGVDVETSMADGLLKTKINPLLPLPIYAIRKMLNSAEIPHKLHTAVIDMTSKLYELFRKYNATLLEVNPVIVSQDGALIAADARVILDDAATILPPEIAEFKSSFTDASVTERIKSEHDFDYIEIDPEGSIGLISTGAGGTMMTIDLIKKAQGRVINFSES